MRRIQTRAAPPVGTVAAETAVVEGVLDFIFRPGARNPYDPYELARDHGGWERGQDYARFLLPFIAGKPARAA